MPRSRAARELLQYLLQNASLDIFHFEAEQDGGGGLSNALEQRKQIIAELRTMNGRLERIEAKLAGRLDVRVTDMPPIKLPPETRAKPEPKPELKPDPKPADGGK